MKGAWLFAALLLLVTPLRLLANDIVVQEPRMAPTIDLAVSDDGKFVVTLSMRGQLSVWDSHSGDLLETLDAGGAGLAITPDNRYVSFNNVVWDWLNRRVVLSLPRTADTSALIVDPARGKIHAFGKNDLSERSLTDGKELARIPLGDVDISTASLTDKGTLMILCKKTGFIFVDPDTNQVTQRIDLEYPRESYFTPEQIAKKPELAKLTRVAGLPGGTMDRSRSRFSLRFGTRKLPPLQNPWFQTFGSDGAATSNKHPISFEGRFSPWFGDTGKMLVLHNDRQVEILDPVDPSKREPLPISFPTEGITRIDTDRSGHLIAISTDQGWYCYDGMPDDPQSWKRRELPSAPPIVTVRALHPDGKTMLYGSPSGAIGGVTLEPGLPHRLLGKMDKEPTLIATFPDGKLMASTQSNHVIFEEGKPPIFEGKGEASPAWNCRDFILRNVPSTRTRGVEVEVVRSNGDLLDSFINSGEETEVHPVKPLVLHFSSADEKQHYKLAEITEKGKYRLLHEFEMPSEEGYAAIPESSDSILQFSWFGTLHRFDARTKKRTKLRDDIPRSIDEIHASADGKFLTVKEGKEPRFFLIPLDPGKPCVGLDRSPGGFGWGVFHWIGYTPNQKGAWLDDHTDDVAHLPQSNVGLWDTGTGKLAAILRVHENGAALILLPDGRCHFNQAAAGLVKRRKAGETTLSAAEPSEDVFKVLAPYLNAP